MRIWIAVYEIVMHWLWPGCLGPSSTLTLRPLYRKLLRTSSLCLAKLGLVVPYLLRVVDEAGGSLGIYRLLICLCSLPNQIPFICPPTQESQSAVMVQGLQRDMDFCREGTVRLPARGR